MDGTCSTHGRHKKRIQNFNRDTIRDHLGDLKYEDNVNMYFKETGQVSVVGSCEQDNKSSGSIKVGKV